MSDVLTTDGPLKVDVRDAVMYLTLNRPDKRNALTGSMFATLGDVLSTAGLRNDIRCVVLQAEGPVFSAGADLSESATRNVSTYSYVASVGRVVRSLAEIAVPTVALVNGPAVGVSCGLALACDFTLMSSTARLSFPFAQRGLVPDGGATWFLPHAIGVKNAKRILMLGGDLDAATSAELGLTTKTVSPERLAEEGSALVAQLAAGPTVSLGLMKRLIDDASRGTLADTLEHEARCQHMTQSVPDAQEAMMAFFEKREPKFSGWAPA